MISMACLHPQALYQAAQAMANMKILSALVLLATGLVACAPSPLYVSNRIGTGGEIPRDGRGEPLWSSIRPAPPAPPMAPMPPAAGIPVQPPQ
jgi:hypothetical protein